MKLSLLAGLTILAVLVSLTINHVILTLFHLLPCLSSESPNHVGMAKRLAECLFTHPMLSVLGLGRDIADKRGLCASPTSMHFFLKKKLIILCASHISLVSIRKF